MPRLNQPTRLLQARTATRQDRVLARANRLTRATDRLFAALLRDLTRYAKNAQGSAAAFQQAQYRVQQVYQQLPELLFHSLADLTRWNRKATAKELVKTLSPAQLSELSPPQLLEAPSLVRVVLNYLFPALSLRQVQQIVFGTSAGLNWLGRLSALTKLASPEAVGTVVATAFSQGKSPQELQKELLPLVGGVRNSARRIARTESMRIGHETQFAAWEQAGDLIIGYEVRSARTERTRPWHRDRHGTQYFKNPTGNQKGLDSMPRPPLEPPNRDGVPAKAPNVAHNCLCYLVPILRKM